MDKILKNKLLQYTGEKQPKPGERDKKTEQLLYPYLPDKNLIEAVNLTIQLGRPLLIKGEPGCGKTRLARAVAYELDLSYEFWPVKTTDRARDGLYTYDVVRRLRDAQLASLGRITDERLAQIDDPMTYVNFGPLGRAFLNDQPTVVLIDEIDKADIDFPNDLLLELDEQRFAIKEVHDKETGKEKEIWAKKTPIVFITSNDEKDLPDAFLRRCLYHYIEFPSKEQLVAIVHAHFTNSLEALVNAIVNRFWKLQNEMRKDKGDAGKKVSTSELMDWFRVLRHHPEDEVIARLAQELLYPGVLLKSWDDYRHYTALMRSEVE